MEEYYEKYAKPLKDLSIQETKSTLEDWQNYTKEEIELLIFIITSLSNDNRNYLNQPSKMKLISSLELLKLSNISVLNKISDFLCRIDTEEYNDITNKVYSKLEHIRNDYNKQLQTNYNTILSKDIFTELRTEYYNTQKWLRDNKEAHTSRNYYDNTDNSNNNNMSKHQSSSSRQRIHKANTQASIPKLNMAKVKEHASRNKVVNQEMIINENSNTNNNINNSNNYHHHSVFTKIFLEKAKLTNNNNRNSSNHNHNHNRISSNNNKNDTNSKWQANQSSDDDNDNESNEQSSSKQRPLSHRNRLPPKHCKHDSLLNYTDTHLTNKIPPSPSPMPMTIPSPCTDQLSQLIQIKTEIMLIQEDIKKLKGKNKLKAPIERQAEEDYASAMITKQNKEIWNEMSIMRKEMNELFNTVKTLNEKIGEVLDDNKSLKKENSQLKDHIYQLKQEKTMTHCHCNSNNNTTSSNTNTNTNANVNVNVNANANANVNPNNRNSNCNSTSYLFRPKVKTNNKILNKNLIHNSNNNNNNNHINNNNDLEPTTTMLKGQRLNYQYDSSSCNTITDMENYTQNENDNDNSKEQ